MDGQLKEKKDVAKYYSKDDVVGDYITKRFRIPLDRVLHRNQVEFVNRHLRSKGITKAVEIAPGPARLTTEIEGVSEGYLLDINREMLEVAKERLEHSGTGGKWKIMVADAFNTGLDDGFTKMIYTFRFIRHFEYEDRVKLYSEMKRILEPGGYLIFDAPGIDVETFCRRGKTSEDYPVYDVLYHKKELLKELEGNGFKVLETRGNLKLYLLEAAISRLDRLGLGKLAEWLIYTIDRLWFSTLMDKPKEWLVLCQKR